MVISKLVSVIIPTYNRAELVVKAIRSVKAQRYRAIQIIIADDGSQDNTAEKVGQFEGIEYYYQEHKGHAAARNLGLKYSKGEYIASLDSDDTWNENFLETAVAGLEQHQADFVFLNWIQIYENQKFPSDWGNHGILKKHLNNSSESWVMLSSRQTRNLFIKICPAPSSSLLIKRSSLNSTWNEEMKIADDWCLILEMILTNSCRAAFNLLPYWTKHIHSGNIYHGREPLENIKDVGFHDEQLMARDFKENLTSTEKRIFKRRLATHYFNYGRLGWRRDGYSTKSLQFILSAFKLAPAGSFFHILQRSFHSLKRRWRIVRSNQKDRTIDDPASRCLEEP